MSLEAFGDEGDVGLSAEDLYNRGWESDPDCDKWWRTGEPDTVFTFSEVCTIEHERSWDDET